MHIKSQLSCPRQVVEAFSAVQFQMEQIQEEIWPFAEWLWNRHPHNVLEIGVRHGGTSALWHGLSTGVVVGVDWEGQDGLGSFTSILHHELRQSCPRFYSVIGDSHLPVTLKEVENSLDDGLFDFIFIDGDHSYEGVKADFINYRPLLSRGGCIAFHDIVDTETTRRAKQGVNRFWNELKSQYLGQWKEFSTQSEWGGIGVLIL